MGNTLPDHQQRVVTENKELDEKLQKLKAFIESEKFASVVTDLAERERLIRQEKAMRTYSEILKERIAAF